MALLFLLAVALGRALPAEEVNPFERMAQRKGTITLEHGTLTVPEGSAFVNEADARAYVVQTRGVPFDGTVLGMLVPLPRDELHDPTPIKRGDRWAQEESVRASMTKYWAVLVTWIPGHVLCDEIPDPRQLRTLIALRSRLASKEQRDHGLAAPQFADWEEPDLDLERHRLQWSTTFMVERGLPMPEQTVHVCRLGARGTLHFQTVGLGQQTVGKDIAGRAADSWKWKPKQEYASFQPDDDLVRLGGLRQLILAPDETNEEQLQVGDLGPGLRMAPWVGWILMLGAFAALFKSLHAPGAAPPEPDPTAGPTCPGCGVAVTIHERRCSACGTSLSRGSTTTIHRKATP